MMTTPTLTTTIHTLRDCDLLAIFDALPMHELLSLISNVCKRWRTLQPAACKRRQRLTIFYTEYALYRVIRSCFFVNSCITNTTNDFDCEHHSRRRPQQHRKQHLLLLNDPDRESVKLATIARSGRQFVRLDQHTVQRLLQTFPSIKSIEFVLPTLDNVANIQAIITLLNGWRANLCEVKLFAGDCTLVASNDEMKNHKMMMGEVLNQLLLTINFLPKLQSLTIDFLHRFIIDDHPTTVSSLDISILSQLTELYFYSYDPLECLLDTLERYIRDLESSSSSSSSPSVLRRIGVLNSPDTIGGHCRLLQLPQWFTAKFTHVANHFPAISLKRFVSNFTISLTTLCIFVRSTSLSTSSSSSSSSSLISLTELIHHLAGAMPNLYHLILNLNFHHRPPQMWSLSSSQPPPPPLPSLSQLRILTLITLNRTHQDLARCMQFGAQFPMIRVLEIWKRSSSSANYNDIECEICAKSNDCEERSDQRLQRLLKCDLEMLRLALIGDDCDDNRSSPPPRKKCLNLKRILVRCFDSNGLEDKEWSWNELLDIPR